MAQRAHDVKRSAGSGKKALTLSDKRPEDGWVVTGDGIVRRDPSAIVNSPTVQETARQLKRLLEKRE